MSIIMTRVRVTANSVSEPRSRREVAHGLIPVSRFAQAGISAWAPDPVLEQMRDLLTEIHDLLVQC